MSFIYVIVALLAVWLILLSLVLAQTLLLYKKLTRGVEGENLEKIWEEHLSRARKTAKEVEKISRDLEKLNRESLGYLKNLKVVRFNPFNELGGNQSFAVSFMDGEGNGVVISSLHGRETTRVYAKPVKDFKEDGFEFSREEKDAISLASHTQS
ncbi:MAG: DUF4446 family protein [Patescibacteria group bacterium]|nr:DUF4446 family protein [Patescibacteria group bacterium]